MCHYQGFGNSCNFGSPTISKCLVGITQISACSISDFKQMRTRNFDVFADSIFMVDFEVIGSFLRSKSLVRHESLSQFQVYVEMSSEINNQMNLNRHQSTTADMDSFPEPKKSIRINLEPLNEHQIVEVKNDGQEIYKSPSTFAEHFSKILSQVDFAPGSEATLDSKEINSPENESLRKRKVSENEDESFDAKGSKIAIANVRSKIHNALTEVGVLFDVLNLAKDRKFLCVDLCSSQLGNSNDSNFGNFSNGSGSSTQSHSVSFLAVAKRKSFADAASLLVDFSSRLRKKQLKESASTVQFYRDLMELRKFWKIRKSQYSILGELALQGSNFHHSSVFEIVKRDGILDVVLPRDVEICDYDIDITFCESQEIESARSLKYSEVSVEKEFRKSAEEKFRNESPYDRTPMTVHTKLKEAQRSFVNKEIFSHLIKEATHMKLGCQCCIVDRDIYCYLTDDIVMTASLRQKVKTDKSRSSGGKPIFLEKVKDDDLLSAVTVRSIKGHLVALHQFEPDIVHYIKKLYIEQMDKIINGKMVHPVSAPILGHQEFFNAAASGARRSKFEEISISKGLLENAIDYALHLHTKLQIYEIVCEMQKLYPCLNFVRRFSQAHRSNALPTDSCFVLYVSIRRPEYSKCSKLVSISINGTSISFATNDSWGSDSSLACLRSLFQECANEMMVSIFLDCGGAFGWSQIGFCGSPFSSLYGVTVLHPNELSKLAFTVVNDKDFRIKFWKPRKAPVVPEDNDVIEDLSFHQLIGEWHCVDYGRIPGTDMFAKFEHLFATFL